MAYSKVGLYGEAGSGKTFTAAQIAIGLHQSAKLQKPVGMFDTEPAASYIIPLFEDAGIDFLVYDESRALSDLMSFMDEAEQECSIVIIDSITHVWREAQDAYLEKINKGRRAKNWNPIYQLEFHHWKPIKAAWQSFTDRFLSSKLHCIVCGRAGSVYEYQKNENNNKMELITSGTKMATEKELGYEPSLLIEMVKHRDGGKIINRALVEKDRANKLNGFEIDYPNYESLKPHFDFLNIGGQHFESMNQRNSEDIYEIGDEDSGFSYEAKKRDVVLEEIKGLFIKYGLDGTGKQEKLKRTQLLEKHFETTSWTKVSSMHSSELKNKYKTIKACLKVEADEQAKESE